MSNKVKIGVQQYMVRDHLEDEKQVRATFHKIRQAGFDSVELCGFLMKDEIDWKGIVDDIGLAVPTTHQIGEDMFADPDKYIGVAEEFGCKYMVAAASIKTDYDDLKSVRALVANLNKLGKAFAGAGIQLLYHNHNAEYAKVDASSTAMEIIINETDTKAVQFEFDSFWTAKSGAYPVDWINMLKGRLPFYHINDAGVPRDDIGKPIRDLMVGKELGRGVMNLNAFLKAAQENDCNNIILETHDNWINDDPFESMEISYKYLAKVLG